MGGIFSIDSPLMQGLSKILDCIFLSILWVVFSLPLITFGASTSALYYTANKTIRNSRGYVWQQFWRGFKSSFKQSTILWLIFLLIMFLLYNDIQIVGLLGSGNLAFAAKVFFTVLMVVLGMVVMYIFPYVARFSAPLKSVAKKLRFYDGASPSMVVPGIACDRCDSIYYVADSDHDLFHAYIRSIGNDTYFRTDLCSLYE